jgi:hypothetical protein
LGPYLKAVPQSAEYVLPSSKKALINGSLDKSVAMVGGPRVNRQGEVTERRLEVMVDRRVVLYVEPMIYYRRVKASRRESFEFES